MKTLTGMVAVRMLALCAALAAAPLAGRAERPMLASHDYVIRWDEAAGRLSVSSPTVDRCRIPAMSFPGKVTSAVREKTTSPQFGSGQSLALRQEDGSVVSITLFDDLPLIAVRKSLRNGGDSLRRIDKLPVVEATLDFGKPASDLVARGTAGLYTLDKGYGSYVFGLVADPESSAGVVFGWASNRRGQGIVFQEQDGDAAMMRARVDYGDLRLPAGGEEEGELLLIGICSDVRDGLEQYAEATARYLDITLRPLPGVYCTWYHARASDEKRLARNTDFAAQHLKPYGLSVMQIDDGWQLGDSKNGPRKVFFGHNPKGPYPSGMKATADTIKSKGMVPGIWFMPFAGTATDPWFQDKLDIFYRVGDGETQTVKDVFKKAKRPLQDNIRQTPYVSRWAGTAIDPSNPKSLDYIDRMVRRIAHDWGYEYFKMDGLYLGNGVRQQYVNNQYLEDDLGKTLRHNPMKTPIEAYHDGLKTIRKAAGDDVFFLGCAQPQNCRSFGTTFGHLDAMRIGPDNGGKWSGMSRGPRYGGRFYFLNHRVWYCDPDPFYVRPSVTYDQAITLASWVALSGQLAATSYDYYELPADRLDIIRRVMPNHGLKTSRPIDFLEEDLTQRWLLTDETKGVKRVVVGYFNWSDEPITLSTPLEKISLDPGKRYVGFDYWGDRFAGPFTGALERSLPGASCRVISIYEQKTRPQIVSTSRHITQGVVDVLKEQWDDSDKSLSGVSEVVAGDPYELRIASPAGRRRWSVVDAKTTSGDNDTTVHWSQEDAGVRVMIKPTATGRIGWKIVFAAGP